ncbi:hypothetical protein LXA43DRAFT_1061052 [Ganoderma leucocontextum]|nr:hypothetical protein LXA43DRAFT_1067059 [Ganoderma leucocontextum]KAI1784124.1 hypothetical protein LXA43DRAFT_1101738 [Ganoderma leucocontextum]KAI1784294.1 hypothetical protein LXA43DRAFT_1101546 [Ganoderma leucocontextum]KAI1784633.1 hypothetical protein LXA43DRAFT_1066568 [Ganoderma leucocontextum]KAI1787252.1 hypothetical protein LXA43DRAFT_1064518 [Ganoderma leucocontextum]
MSFTDDFVHHEVINYVNRIVSGHPSTLAQSIPITGARLQPASLNTSYTMSTFLMLVRALPPLVKVDREFSTLYRHLADLPYHERPGVQDLREFGEEYSIITRVRRMQAMQDTFCAAMHAYLQARREAEEAAAEYAEETNRRTEDKLRTAGAEVVEAKAELLASLKEDIKCRDELTTVVRHGVYWDTAAAP